MTLKIRNRIIDAIIELVTMKCSFFLSFIGVGLKSFRFEQRAKKGERGMSCKIRNQIIALRLLII